MEGEKLDECSPCRGSEPVPSCSVGRLKAALRGSRSTRPCPEWAAAFRCRSEACAGAAACRGSAGPAAQPDVSAAPARGTRSTSACARTRRRPRMRRPPPRLPTRRRPPCPRPRPCRAVGSGHFLPRCRRPASPPLLVCLAAGRGCLMLRASRDNPRSPACRCRRRCAPSRASSPTSQAASCHWTGSAEITPLDERIVGRYLITAVTSEMHTQR